MKRELIYIEAISTYGTRTQQLVAIEEMAELMQAIVKCDRGITNNIAEEVADVEIMLEQLKLMHSISDEVKYIKRRKKDRLAKNLKL